MPGVDPAFSSSCCEPADSGGGACAWLEIGERPVGHCRGRRNAERRMEHETAARCAFTKQRRDGIFGAATRNENVCRHACGVAALGKEGPSATDASPRCSCCCLCG